MDITVMPELTAWFAILTHWSDSLRDLIWNVDWTVLAQQFNQDIMKDIQDGFNNFVKSGQLWATIIGFVLGYLLRSVTAA
jgi:hypothetical protein